MLPFSAVPVIAGLVLLVDVDTVEITGTTGAVVSIFPATALEAVDVLPAASVTVAVRLSVSDPVNALALAV